MTKPTRKQDPTRLTSMTVSPTSNMFKKTTPLLHGESCKPNMVACAVSLTTPAAPAEQLAGPAPGVLEDRQDSLVRHWKNFLEEITHSTMLKTQREFAT